MDFRVVRKYFYQKWRGHSLKNNTRREIVFLLLGAHRYALAFGNLLRLTFIRVNSVMDDGAIIGLFMDSDMAQFVKFATMLPSGEVLSDMSLLQLIPTVDNDLSSLVAYLDLPRIFHEVGVDLASAGPDPMSSPEAFYLKLLWPGYTDNDEKYVAIAIAGILATRCELDQNSVRLPPYSMHLTEVGMHLKSLEAVDASLAWALPALKNEGLRLARFLGKSDTERYFSVTDSPCHHSDKVVSLNVSLVLRDAERIWSIHDVGTYLRDGEFLSAVTKTQPDGIEENMAHVPRLCAEAALFEERENDATVVPEELFSPNFPLFAQRRIPVVDGDRRSFTREREVALDRSKWRDSSRVIDLPSKRLPLGNLADNTTHPILNRRSTQVYYDETRGPKTKAAPPAGVENDDENNHLSSF